MNDTEKRKDDDAPAADDTPAADRHEPEAAGDNVTRPGVWSPPEMDPVDAGAEGEAGTDETPVERLSRLEAEKADLTDRLLRTVADMENLRKRADRDLNDTRRYAVAKFAGDLLAVGDNLQRALAAAPEDWLASADETVKSVIDGVQMTARELDRVLEKHGIARIEARGERFDPHRHQAMFEVPNPDVPNGTVIEEVQPGYMIGERVLRAAMVGVARGGPKPGEAPAAAAEDDQPKEEEGSAEA